MRLCSLVHEHARRLVRPHQPEHLVTDTKQFTDNGGADEPARSGNEDPHDKLLNENASRLPTDSPIRA